MPWWTIFQDYENLKKEHEELEKKSEVIWNMLVKCRKDLLECRTDNSPVPPPLPPFEIAQGGELVRDTGIPAMGRTDSEYKLISLEEFEKWLAYDEVDKERYINNFYDCDNFATDLVTFANRWLPGIAIGEIWLKSRAHAVNIFIDVEKKVWHVEPQNDMIKECDLNDITFMRF